MPGPGREGGANRRRNATLAAGLTALLVMLAVLQLARADVARLSGLAFDAFQRISPRASTADPGVVVVDIDEASMQRLGQWPWPRDLLGMMVDRLGQAGAAAIVFDMVFPEPDRTSLTVLAARLAQRGTTIALPEDPAASNNDLALAQAIGRNPVVLGVALSDQAGGALPRPKAALSFAGSDPRDYLPGYAGGVGNIAVLNEAAGGLGSFSFPPSHDNIVRAMPLVARADDALYPGLSVEALRIAQGARGIILRSSDGKSRQGGRPGLEAIKVGVLELPSDPEGLLFLHYSGMQNMRRIPAATLLDADPAEFAASINGRIVLIGTSALGLRDLVATPLAGGVPGVVVHAEMIDQILNQDFLIRPDWARGAELATAVGLSLLLMLALASGRALAAVIALPLLGGAAVLGTWQAFSARGVLLDPVPAILCLLAVFIVSLPVLLWLGNRDRRYIRAAFGRYLSPMLVDRLSRDPSALELGGETREISVLFTDIRGFTDLSESMAPQDLTVLLNGVLTPLTGILLKHEATIDKYIGDAIMALWNAPVAITDHPARACRAMLALRAAMERLNRDGRHRLNVGMGLHCGTACVGNLGSSQRFSYSAVGDTVNLASRVEGMTKHYGVDILITESVRQAAPGFATLEADRLRVVGRRAPVVLHVLLGDERLAREPDFQRLQRDHQAFLQDWRDGDFAAAAARLTGLMARAPDLLRPLYRVYDERLRQLLRAPPQDWDGIFTATEK